MASVVNICNSALNLIGASTISALTEDTKNARLCNQRYEPVRNRVFRSHNWNCLIKRVQLAANSTDPVIEFAKSYSRRNRAKTLGYERCRRAFAGLTTPSVRCPRNKG